MELHTERIQKLCRICTRKLGRVSHDTQSTHNVMLLQEFFQCDIEFNPSVHPPRFCNSCYLTVKCTLRARQDGSVHRTSLVLQSWAEHSDDGCATCAMVVGRSGGGRPKKKKNIKRCPTSLTAHIQAVAGPRHQCSTPLTPDRFLSCSEPGLGLCTEDVTCKCCNNILDEPVEFPCKHLVCRVCCLQLLTINTDSLPCPHWQQIHPQADSSFQAPPPLAVKFLQQLVVRCDREECTEAVHLGDLQAHLDSKCRKTSTTRQAITLEQVMDQSPSVPPTRIEMQAAGLVVRKILHSQPEGQQGVISLPTGGCVSSLWFPG